MSITIQRTVNLDAPLIVEKLQGGLFTGEADAHSFLIHPQRGGEALTVAGGVTAHFYRYGGESIGDVALEGEAVDGAARVTLSRACYEEPGSFALTIYVREGESNTAIYSAVGTMTATDHGNIITSNSPVPATVDDLVAMVGLTSEERAELSAVSKRLLAQFPVAAKPLHPQMLIMVDGEDQLSISDAVTDIAVYELRLYAKAAGDVSDYGEANITFKDMNVFSGNPMDDVVYNIPIEALSGRRVSDNTYVSIRNGTTLYVPGAGNFELDTPVIIPDYPNGFILSCDIGKVGLFYYQNISKALSSLETRVKALEQKA